MAKTVADRQIIKEVVRVIPYLKRLPSNHLWVDYDEEADVLYMSFERPQRATDSVLQNDNVLLRYRGKKLVGVTIIGTKALRLKA
jgi:uncharacterized protein YuzE